MTTPPRAAIRACWRRCAVAVLGAGAMSASVGADLSFANMFRSNVYFQTSDAGAGYAGSFFTAGITASGPTGATSGVLTVPTSPSSTQTLSSPGGVTFQYQSAFLPSQAAMDAAFPAGTYGFSVAGMDAAFGYAGDHYPGSTPALTGTSFTSLQNVNPGTAAAVTFSPFDTGSGATESLLFFTIFDQTASQLVVNAAFLPPSTAGYTIAAGTLTAGHAYTYELIYSNRLQVPATGTTFTGQIGYDDRTLGNFSAAAVPEPSTLALWAAGALLVGARARRRAA
jgi:hypothetical protein